MTRTILFDVDMTLLNSGGAGGRGMRLAFEQLYGIADGFKRIEFSGRTDQHILRAALEQHGLLEGPEQFVAELARFQEAYYRLLPQTLAEADGRVLPGVAELVEALAGRDDVRIGLATGNFRKAAFLKLSYFGLDGHLREGGFGDDAEDRGEMVGIAIERVANGAGAGEVWVVGDTRLDIEAARANGARALAVATGPMSVGELEAAGADVAVEDLSETASVIEVLAG